MYGIMTMRNAWNDGRAADCHVLRGGHCTNFSPKFCQLRCHWIGPQAKCWSKFSNFVNCFTEYLQVPVRQKTTRIGSSADINYAGLCICGICHLWFQVDLLRNAAVSRCHYCKWLTFEAITSRMNYVVEYAVKEKRHPFVVQMVHPYLFLASRLANCTVHADVLGASSGFMGLTPYKSQSQETQQWQQTLQFFHGHLELQQNMP